MSDEASAPAKRGRKAAATDKSAEKVESKKRQRKEVKQVESGDEDGVAPKRGRGRPKGSTKRKSPAKPKSKSAAGRRGRPKKDDKGRDSGDEDNEENDAGEDEDD
uniref:High mobility group protein I n=1 Tax=Lygus hesperus TaxID=30085 RepID=A0A146LPF4_LYGHE